MKKKRAKHGRNKSMFWAIVKEFLKAKAQEIWAGLGQVWEVIWIGGGLFGVMALAMMLLGLPEYFLFHDTAWWKKFTDGTPSMWGQIMLGGMVTLLGLLLCLIIWVVISETFKWLRDNWIDATNKVKSERRWGRD